jgi:hypothetical protein
MLLHSVVNPKPELQELKFFALAEPKPEPESKLFKVGTVTTTNHYDSTALLVSKFLGFSVSYVLERKIPRAPESGAFVYLSG